MLHDEHVRSAGRGHHHTNVDAAGDRMAERLDGRWLRQKIRILNSDPLAGAADGQVMKDLDRRRGALRLDPRDVDRDLAFVMQLWEEVLADEQLAGLLDPVLAERRPDRMHALDAQHTR